MNWPGKADCFEIIQQHSIGTLIPVLKESVDFDTTENLFIEGDNLEVLKLLQKSYLGKIKMICIDPPYNTENDFIYPDNYSESLETYLNYTGQVDAEGRKFSTNTDTRLGRTSVTMSGLKVDACRGCIDLKMQSLQSMVNWNTVR